MSNEKKEKTYTAQEAALKVLEKAREMLAKSEFLKSANSSHEIEEGEEPRNDDAECPDYLADADIEGAGDAAAKKKADKSKKPAQEGEPEHEEGMSEEENKEHDAAENEADEEDEDIIEADEEPKTKKADEKAESEESDEEQEEEAEEGEDKAKKKKNPFEKKEAGNGLSKLRKFIENRDERLQKSLPASKKSGKVEKNKKMEKFLGMSPKDSTEQPKASMKPQQPKASMKPQQPQQPQKPQSGGSGMKGY